MQLTCSVVMMNMMMHMFGMRTYSRTNFPMVFQK